MGALDRQTLGGRLRRWSRGLHRHLSFFFSGAVVVYAVSGIAMNHKDTFNPNYEVTRQTYRTEAALPPRQGSTKADILPLLQEIGEEEHYTKHYFPDANTLKVFLKGGSNLLVDMRSGEAVYERVERRPLLGTMSRLHYNPGRWWTVFADVFAVSLLVLVASGFAMMKGRKGLWGIGGVELLAGILVPLLFGLIIA